VGADCKRVPCYSRQYLSDDVVMCMQGRMSLMRRSISSTSTWVRKLLLLNRQIPQQIYNEAAAILIPEYLMGCLSAFAGQVAVLLFKSG